MLVKGGNKCITNLGNPPPPPGANRLPDLLLMCWHFALL